MLYSSKTLCNSRDNSILSSSAATSTVTRPHDRQPVKPPDSYGTRDPLQGGNHRGGGEINTVPPVRTPVQKDRGSQ